MKEGGISRQAPLWPVQSLLMEGVRELSAARGRVARGTWLAHSMRGKGSHGEAWKSDLGHSGPLRARGARCRSLPSLRTSESPWTEVVCSDSGFTGHPDCNMTAELEVGMWTEEWTWWRLRSKQFIVEGLVRGDEDLDLSTVVGTGRSGQISVYFRGKINRLDSRWNVGVGGRVQGHSWHCVYQTDSVSCPAPFLD